MSLRKNRIACQGLNNLSQIDLITNKSAPFLKLTLNNTTQYPNIAKTKTKTKTSNHNISKYQSPNIKLTTEHNFSASMGTRTDQNWNLGPHCPNTLLHQTKKSPTLLCSKQSKSKLSQSLDKQPTKAPQKFQSALEQIRSLYKYNANVRKMVKAWGFQNNGCISVDQFQQMISKHFDPSITKNDCQELFGNFSGDKKNLDLLSFMKVVFDEQPFTKPRINVLDPTIKNVQNSSEDLPKTLVRKINNLNEGSLLKERSTNVLKVIQSSEIHNNRRQSNLKMTNSESVGKSTPFTLDKTQPSLHQTLWAQSNPKYTFSTTKSHGVEFLPTQFYDKNQQKTRFGATPAIELNNQSLVENKREKIIDENMKVMDQLQKQRQLQKARYENKLSRIRQLQDKQKENVQMIEQRAEQRDKGNMKKLREQTLAYNYVNFVHNEWK